MCVARLVSSMHEHTHLMCCSCGDK